MGRALKIKKSATVDIGFDNPKSAEPATGRENDYYGVVGGNTALSTAAYPVVKVRVYIAGASEADGYIIRQKGSRKFLVTDGTNTGVVALVSNAVDAAGEASIVATDSASGTYYVTKLTAHRALVTRGTGTQFATGESVPWVLGTAVENVSVKIPNA